MKEGGMQIIKCIFYINVDPPMTGNNLFFRLLECLTKVEIMKHDMKDLKMIFYLSIQKSQKC